MTPGGLAEHQDGSSNESNMIPFSREGYQPADRINRTDRKVKTSEDQKVKTAWDPLHLNRQQPPTSRPTGSTGADPKVKTLEGQKVKKACDPLHLNRQQ